MLHFLQNVIIIRSSDAGYGQVGSEQGRSRTKSVKRLCSTSEIMIMLIIIIMIIISVLLLLLIIIIIIIIIITLIV